MSGRPSEAVEVHTRLQKCTLEVDNSREYWTRIGLGETPTVQVAFDECWFGARSFDRTAEILAHIRARFEPYPEALQVLASWPDMGPDTRRLICHWHLQLSDPLYRAFTGRFLVERRQGTRAAVTRDLATAWVDAQQPGRWSPATRIQFASKLLSAAAAAGLVEGKRDPRRLCYPRAAGGGDGDPRAVIAQEIHHHRRLAGGAPRGEGSARPRPATCRRVDKGGSIIPTRSRSGDRYARSFSRSSRGLDGRPSPRCTRGPANRH